MTRTKITAAKEGDVGAVFRYNVVVNKPADFTGVSAFWKIRSKTSGETKAQLCDVLGSNTLSTALRRTLILQYTTVDGDLDEPGSYLQEWELIWPDGRRRTFPSDGWELLLVGGKTSDAMNIGSYAPLVTDDGRMILTDDGRIIWITI